MTLTAVEAFARLHDAGDLPEDGRSYRTLLPASPPRPGEQYAFAVNLDACTGCKSCVVACHSLNGLDDDESWRAVGLLQGSGKVAFHQTVTTACHHCVDPACLRGCPVDAYEKDPVTGIVAHLDDQCIGCSYCTLTCPYEVPRFNAARGIVRKCDMCRGRLAEGEAPACVQSCPNEAISITIVSKADVVARSTAPAETLVPGAPPSSLTAPTTRYETARPLPSDIRAADHFALRPAQAHPPLAVMLVLTQMAVAVLAIEVVAGAGAGGRLGPALAAASGVVALAASTLHLGRPRYAFRAVLGLGHSWLSREIVAFGAFAVAAPAYAVHGSRALAIVALVTGFAGVGCSVLLYAVTGRTWWRPARTSATFLLSGLSTGGAASACWLAAAGAGDVAARVGLVGTGAVVAKLVLDLVPLRHSVRGERLAGAGDLERAARLLRGELWGRLQLRVALGALGLAALAAASAAASGPGGQTTLVVAAFCLSATVLVAAELVERNLFFQVAVAPRMPGELR